MWRFPSRRVTPQGASSMVYWPCAGSEHVNRTPGRNAHKRGVAMNTIVYEELLMRWSHAQRTPAPRKASAAQEAAPRDAARDDAAGAADDSVTRFSMAARLGWAWWAPGAA